MSDSTIFVEFCIAISTNIEDMVKAIQPKSLFGRRLREARLRARIPQDKLGVMIGIDECSSSARISRYESGIHSPPFELVKLIADVLKLPASYFYCDDDKLAEIMRIYFMASDDKRDNLLDYSRNL